MTKKMRLGLICLALGLFGMNSLSSASAASCGAPPQCSTDAECVAYCGPDSGGGTCYIVPHCYRICLCRL
jgi:hypothetical protein